MHYKQKITLFWRKPAATIGERTRRRVVLHVLPFLFFLYVLAYLDRVNVSVAQLGMSMARDEGGLGFSATTVGFGAGLFFWAYWILEIPSTLSVLRWGARWVFARILVLWGFACVLMGFIGLAWFNNLCWWLETPTADGVFRAIDWLARNVFQLEHTGNLNDFTARQYCMLRFMLGFFEGGFFPSVLFYLTMWFRAQDRARAVAFFMAAIPFSSLIGSPISGLMLKLDWGGLPGWRWIFILQGIAPILAGIATLFYLPDRPEKARWLEPEEKDWLIAELRAEADRKKKHEGGRRLSQLGSILLMTTLYFCINVTGYSLAIFMPKLFQSQIHGLSNLKASLLSALPYVMGVAGMLINGWHSDKTKERIVHVAVPLTCLSVSIFLAARLDGCGVAQVLILIFLVGTFMYAQQPAFWPIPSMFLGSAAAGSAIGFINMTGTLGGFFGPAMMGNYVDQNKFAEGLTYISRFPLAAAVIILIVGWSRRSKRGLVHVQSEN